MVKRFGFTRVLPAEAQAIAARMLSDRNPQPLQTRITESWLMIAALEFGARNPGLGQPTKKAIQAISDKLAVAITTLHPEAKPAIDFQRTFDYAGFNEETIQQFTADIMKDQRQIIVDTLICDIWLAVSVFQMCLRHPNIHADAAAMRPVLEGFIRQMIGYIRAYDKRAADLMQMGNDPQYDVITPNRPRATDKPDTLPN